jgi:alkylhydroperoxidase family enzyme
MVEAVLTADDSPLFTEVERSAIALAVELTKTAKLSRGTFERAMAHFDERQIVELVVNVGVANLNNRVTEAFAADPDSHP